MAGCTGVERDRYVSPKVVADYLGVQPNTVVAWARAGRIPSIKMSPKVVRFRLSAVLAALGISEETHADGPAGRVVEQ